jgi:SAM-dependent methyltransferase
MPATDAQTDTLRTEDNYSLEAFAWWYDRFAAAESGRQSLQLLRTLVLPELPPPAFVCDLCCGTGQLAAMLCEQGYLTVNVDASAAMLEYARMNAPRADCLRADAREFRLPEPCQLVTCMHDSLNHLRSESELAEVFARVREALRPGGRFLFDLHSAASYQSAARAGWAGERTAIEDDAVTIIQTQYDASVRKATCRFVILRREDEGWQRHDVGLEQHPFEPKAVIGLLDRAGFNEVKAWEGSELGRSRRPGQFVYLAR